MSCASCVRIFMIVFNFLFTLIGFTLLAGGLYFFFTETSAQRDASSPQFSNIGYFLLGIAAIGCITLLLGILGCCGAFHYSRCILSFYFVLLLILFAAEIAAGVIAFKNKDVVRNTIDNALSETSKEGGNSKLIQTIEWLFGCCGYSDGIEPRCLINQGVDFIQGNSPVTQSCKAHLDVITKNIYALFGCLIALALVQLLGLIFASILCCAAKDRLEYTQYHPVYQ